MSDILILRNKIENTIQLGESHFREFKSALEGIPGNKKPRAKREICKDIGEALVAFANADGGELIVGVEDDGSITGVPHSEEDIQQMLNAWKSHVHLGSHLPINNNVKLEIEGKKILFFDVSKGTSEIYQLSDGRCVRRKDKSTLPIAIRDIIFERQEIKSREYDRQFVDGATVNDLDIPLVQSIADSYLKGLSVELYLQQIGLADYANGLRLKMAALLLFAKDIQRWHPRSQVRILKVVGNQLNAGEKYNVISDETIRGNIFQLLANSWSQLRPFLAYKTEFGNDAKFEQKYIYPEGACREALINAIAHRDYNIQNGIDVFIYNDRIEIKNPGALLSTIKIKDLESLMGAHESRNVFIAKVLRENNYMRELGEGIKRMFELMEEIELDKPQLYSNTTWFSITLPHKSVFTDQQERWLSVFNGFILSPRQKKIIVLGMDDKEISPRDIYLGMNTNDRDTYDREVTGLRNHGILLEIRTNAEAKAYGNSQNIPKQNVARFKIRVPDGKVLTSVKNLEGSQLTDEEKSKRVFVGNLPPSIDKDALKLIFEKFGEVDKVVIPFDRQRNRPKGYGFIYFVSSSSVLRAIRELDGTLIDERRISVRQYV